MKITVKTAGHLGRYLPPGGAKNIGEIEVDADATPSAVMQQLGMPSDGSYLVILNGSSVPRAERGERRLAANDTLAIMPPLKGG